MAEAETTKKQNQIVVTKTKFEDAILEVDNEQYEIAEVKRKKEFVKTVFGPIKNATNKTVIYPYRRLQCDKIDNIIPIDFAKKKLKINNISFFLEVLEPTETEDDDNKENQPDDILATFEVGPNREGWITRDYQKYEIIAYPAGGGTHLKKNEKKFKFEYPIKGGKLLTKTKPLKK